MPGHAVNIVIKQALEVFPHMIDLREGFVPEVLKQALRLIHILTVTKPVGPGFGFHRFHINPGDKVGKERHVLLHVRSHLVDQQCHLDHQLRIRRRSDMGFLDGGINIPLRGVCTAQLCCPDGDLVGDLSLRLGRQTGAKLFNLGMVRCTPVVHHTPPTEELVGSMVLDSPGNLSIGEVGEPLEQQGTEVDTQLAFASKPLFPLGRGALQIGEYHVGEGLPGDDLDQLDQWMGGRDIDGHGLHTAGGVESREIDAHGEAAFSVAGGRVLLASDHEGIIVLEQLQPLTLWLVSIPISRQRRIIKRANEKRKLTPLKAPHPQLGYACLLEAIPFLSRILTNFAKLRL